MKVVHCKREPYDIYIGRPSVWGNPYIIGPDGDRAEVIIKYEAHMRHALARDPKLVEQLLALDGKTLGCFCAPLPCHGDVLVKLIKEFKPMAYIIAGTGSRSFDAPHNDDHQRIYVDLCDFLLAERNTHPDLQVMSGGAEGWDEAIACAAITYDIPLIMCIPNRGYGDYYWRRNSKYGRDRSEAFSYMLEMAVEVQYVCDSIYVNFEGRRMHANFVRNAKMCERADFFAVFDPSSRGTGECFARIRRINKPYRIFS